MAETFVEIRELTDRYVMHTYGRLPLALVRGQGVRVWDSAGREYLDFVTGLAVNGLGHGHPRVVEAIREAAGYILHTSNLYHIEPQARLAERLVASRAWTGSSSATAARKPTRPPSSWCAAGGAGTGETATRSLPCLTPSTGAPWVPWRRRAKPSTTKDFSRCRKASPTCPTTTSRPSRPPLTMPRSRSCWSPCRGRRASTRPIPTPAGRADAVQRAGPSFGPGRGADGPGPHRPPVCL